jgi:hypothetical protein
LERLARIGGIPDSSQTTEPAVYRTKKTRNATFAMRVGDGRSGICTPLRLQRAV